VLRVLYLIFNEGYTGAVDLAAEAIRLTRVLARESAEPEVAGLLALMLLHHARRAARTDGNGCLIPLDEQDRRVWDTSEIAEGVRLLQAALSQGQIGEYQMQAAIAALHDDAQSAEETDWPQILAWYDDLLILTGNPAVALNRAVALGHVVGPVAGLAALAEWQARLAGNHRLDAVRGYLHEHAGNLEAAAEHYARAARQATSVAERDHLYKRAARARTANPGGDCGEFARR